ncbi:MAG: hypothetical protein JEZ08_16680 [Clostridiales bacterium]|nr:hypothetical protein [Clostridiales bacterium]
MFSSFKKAFTEDTRGADKVPNEILKLLSGELPSNLEYRNVGDGFCAVFPINDSLTLDMLIDVGSIEMGDFTPRNTGELFEFAFRTQQTINLKHNEDGTINLNGEKFTINEFLKSPLKGEQLGDGTFVAQPMSFIKPHLLTITAGNIEKDFTFERKPYSDMHKAKFESINDTMISLKYLVDELNNSLQFTITYNLAGVEKVDQIIENLMFFNNFLSKKVMIYDSIISQGGEGDERVLNLIEIWNKAKEIEDKLSLDFTITHPVEAEDYVWIDRLHKSFIEDEFYKREARGLNWIIDDFEYFGDSNMQSFSNMAFEYSQSSVLTLFNENISLIDVIFLNNVSIKNYNKNSDKDDIYTVELTTPDSGISYMIIRHFINKNEADYLRGKLVDFDVEKIQLLR